MNELRESGKPGRVCDGVVDCPDFSGKPFLCRQPHYVLNPGGYKDMSSTFRLTNSALVYEPKCGGRVGGSRGVSANDYSCIQEPKYTLEI